MGQITKNLAGLKEEARKNKEEGKLKGKDDKDESNQGEEQRV
eukprot:CAMPEP_0201283332 /NCGR_PEP_ID=MMETSP1317-20130820/8249_1 /ASSEMBLY_ACC=CAM_ASM_000770 /TAXON_ID=187299 /ORGANISM="Undescribed Undescribed, Strain Undescribed" /LENGTH=41 /DNA_ID= /DNA_START= /DNA_END= /DNA_ORIENTATION=